MPLFEYLCRACHSDYEAIVFGAQPPACPKCGARDGEKRLSVFAVGSARSVTPTPASGGCGSCGDPRGPGACERD